MSSLRAIGIISEFKIKPSCKKNMSKNHQSGPDFMCVGPHKTGTGWLFETLNYHKQIFPIDEKEIRYYTKLDHAERMPNRMYPKGIKRTLKWFAIGRFHLFWTYIIYKHVKGDYSSWWQYLRFESHFHLKYKNLVWYKKLFRGPSGLLKSDFSPSYATMTMSTIKTIKKDFPNVKILFFLRDPVDRIWSHTNMLLANKMKARSEKDIRRLMMKYSHTESYMSYPLQCLDHWLTVFGEKNVFVGFYDYLLEDPVNHFKLICQFLEIDDDINKALDIKIEGYRIGHLFSPPKQFEKAEDVIKHRWKKSKLDLVIPKGLHIELIHQYYDQVAALDTKYPNSYPAKWLRDYDQLLSKNPTH